MQTNMQYDVSCDVAVIGGGIAGVAAALQAARSGMKTILIEKTILLGGLATTGLVYVYLPLCDGNGHQVSFGLTEELMRASLKYGPGEIPDSWKDGKDAPEVARFRCIFSPASFILAMDEMLEQAGVDVWVDTRVCDAVVEQNKLTAAVCENASGRGMIRAKQFIDASGDCTLARRAGIPCHDEFNFLSYWAIEYDELVSGSPLGDKIHMICDGYPWDPAKCPDEALFRGISGKIVSDFVAKSRRMIRERYQKAYAADKTRSEFYPVKLPAMPQFRKIFSIDAAYVLDSGENQKHFGDSVGLVADWRKAGPVWEIPYRSLIPAKPFGGFIAAGRCTGAKNDAWEVTRVIPPAAMTGQIAGLAAAMSVKAGVEPYELSVTALQNELKTKYGFALHLEDVGLKAEKSE